jgi:hypothetical protein
MTNDTCVDNCSGAFLKIVAVSTPKRARVGDLWPPIPAGIQDQIRLKNQLRRKWHGARAPDLRADVNHLQRSNDLRAQ